MKTARQGAVRQWGCITVVGVVSALVATTLVLALQSFGQFGQASSRLWCTSCTFVPSFGAAFQDDKEMDRKALASSSLFQDMGQLYRSFLYFQSLMDAAAGGRANVIGNIAWYPMQVWYYALFVHPASVKTVCEVGFGAGHSTVLYLTVNPAATVYTWDLFPDELFKGEVVPKQHLFQKAAIDFISKADVAKRWHIIAGGSNTSVPNFAELNPGVKCDVVSIDGSHSTPQPYFDLLHFKALSHAETIVLMDDVQSDPGMDFERAVKEGWLLKMECLNGIYYADTRFSHGAKQEFDKRFCSAKYAI